MIRTVVYQNTAHKENKLRRDKMGREKPTDYKKASWGRREYIKFINGYKVTRGEAIKAKCYDCMGQFIDGKFDCEGTDCSLYSFRGYKGKNPLVEEVE